MRKLTALLVVAGALSLLTASAASALTISVFDPGSSGISSFSYSVSGATINLYEDWSNGNRGFLQMEGLDAGVDYTVNKYITNSTGFDWTLFSDELLDPSGQPNDAFDISPQPGWIPAGYSTSNDGDGLSFAQGSGLPRTSTSFASLFVDELAGRDFLEFFNGTVSGAGGNEFQTFGLRDSDPTNNEPFLLAQSPNEHTLTPEPGTLMLLGSGLLGLGLFLRKK